MAEAAVAETTDTVNEGAQPDAPTSGGADAEPASGEEARATEDTATEDTEETKAELEQTRQELEEVQDRLLRAQAEFQNTRKRLQREKDEMLRYAAFGTIQSLLPVVDDMEKALGSDHMPDDVRTGLAQIHGKMFAAFERAGLKTIDQHEHFDPRLHEALARAPAEGDQKDQQILEVWRKGYLFKDRLMRASWVKVAVVD